MGFFLYLCTQILCTCIEKRNTLYIFVSMYNTHELIKIGVARKDIPSTLFKYYRLDENLLHSIREGYLWFNSFEGYNDPYEGKFNLRNDYTISEIRRWLPTEYGLLFPSPDTDELLKKNFPKILRSEIRRKAKEIRVCCFSTKWNDLLMWAHYADSYKGVCLVFDVAELADSLSYIQKVHYEEEFDVVDYLHNQQETIVQMVCTKAKEWEYEDEYRFINTNNTAHKVPIKMSALRAVIIGCKCNKRGKIYKELIASLPASVEIIYSTPSVKAYKLCKRSHKV